MRIVNAIGILFLLPFSYVSAGSANRVSYQSPEVTPWPKPASFTNGTATLRVTSAPLGITATTTSQSQILSEAINRTLGAIAAHSPPSPLHAAHKGGAASSSVSGRCALAVTVASDDESLGATTNESYVLTVAKDGTASLDAPTVYGALHGLQSFASLWERASSSDDLAVRGLPWSIADAPRFSHRATLIDTSRHFLQLATLEAHIDAMAQSKLNVLHWHLVDFQAFPFASQAQPKLVLGAYSAQETYTIDDVKHIVRYAKERGVRVMAEIDTPGHTTSWGVGYPNIIAACPNALAVNPGNGCLDPSVNETFEVVEALLGEVGAIAPDSFFHLGGDEVRFVCWNESSRVKAFMVAQGFGCCSTSSFAKLEQYYENRLFQSAARALGKDTTLVLYQEVFDNNVTLPSKVAFDVWLKGGALGHLSIPEEIAKIVKSGHEVILANGNDGNWYLNDGWGNGKTVSLWPDVYALDPLNGTEAYNLTPAEIARVIGGEASLWGEEIDDSNLAMKAWPRCVLHSMHQHCVAYPPPLSTFPFFSLS